MRYALDPLLLFLPSYENGRHFADSEDWQNKQNLNTIDSGRIQIIVQSIDLHVGWEPQQFALMVATERDCNDSANLNL